MKEHGALDTSLNIDLNIAGLPALKEAPIRQKQR